MRSTSSRFPICSCRQLEHAVQTGATVGCWRERLEGTASGGFGISNISESLRIQEHHLLELRQACLEVGADCARNDPGPDQQQIQRYVLISWWWVAAEIPIQLVPSPANNNCIITPIVWRTKHHRAGIARGASVSHNPGHGGGASNFTAGRSERKEDADYSFDR